MEEGRWVVVDSEYHHHNDTQILISNCAMVFNANEKREKAILSSLQVTRPRFQKSINL